MTIKHIISALTITLLASVPAAAVPFAPNAAVKKAPVTVIAPANHKISLNGVANKAKLPKAPSASTLLWESFETESTDFAWLPDGWTRISNTEFATVDDDHWFSYSQLSEMPTPSDGNKYMIIFFNSDFKDEWIVSPTVEIPATGYELTFDWWGIPLFFYVLDDAHVDLEKLIFIDRVKTLDLEVLVKAGSGDWQKVYSVESQYEDMSYEQLAAINYTDMQHVSVSLDQYAGESVQIGFRYVGTDANTMALDAVKVDIPPMHAAYMAPLCRQFFGLTPDTDLSTPVAALEFYPVNTPLTWYNTSYNDSDADYLWTYQALGDDSQPTTFTSSDPDQLVVTHKANYSSEATLRNNLYEIPSLLASSPTGAFTPTEYKEAAVALQAGGRPEILFEQDGESVLKRFGLLPSSPVTDGLDIYTKDALDFGRPRIPIFGYSEDTRTWWRNYTYRGEPGPDDDAYCTGYMNWVHFPESPMLVRGASAAALGRISDSAKFRLEVRAVDEEGEIAETPLAVAYLTGADAMVAPYSEALDRDIIVLNFVFDKPLEFDFEHFPNGCLFEVTGYTDGGVTYFAPLQSVKPHPYEFSLGFYRHYRKYMGVEDTSYGYVANFTNEYGDLYSTFAISLDASYEWFDALERYEFEVDPYGVTIPLKTSVKAEDFTVSAPDWLDVTFAGTYDKASACFTVVGTPKDHETAKVVISAPGIRDVELTVVAVDKAAIDAINTDNANINSDVYNAQGILMLRNASPEQLRSLPAGLYIHGNKKVIIR